MIASIRMDRGEYVVARDLIQKAVQQTGESFVEAEYSLACLESRLHNRTEALHHLERAFQMGFNDFKQLYKDAGLQYLRDSADFEALLKRYQAPPASAIVEHTPAVGVSGQESRSGKGEASLQQ